MKQVLRFAQQAMLTVALTGRLGRWDSTSGESTHQISAVFRIDLAVFIVLMVPRGVCGRRGYSVVHGLAFWCDCHVLLLVDYYDYGPKTEARSDQSTSSVPLTDDAGPLSYFLHADHYQISQNLISILNYSFLKDANRDTCCSALRRNDSAKLMRHGKRGPHARTRLFLHEKWIGECHIDKAEEGYRSALA